MFELCAPALIYLFFSIIQILIDSYLGLYNTAVIKIIVIILMTLLLNVLCEQNLGVISWIIVFIQLIFLTSIVSFVLYIFGLNGSQGKIQKQPYNPPETIIQPNELILEKLYPKHGITKYLHIPISLVSSSNDDLNANICKYVPKPVQEPVPAPSAQIQKTYKSPPPFGSSSPEYESFVSY
jgi:hypothetical protein